ncbi:MAG: adenosylhomocysteinase [Clostridia bacterium]|nr:adenosylhomocysteinase [Clostridia bacterium]
MENYLIRDLSLAPSGQLKIDWVAAHMPVLNQIRTEFQQKQPFKGYKVALSIHLEAKTAYLALTLREGGAEVLVTGSNPLSTQDDVAAALVQAGMKVYAWHDASPEEYKNHLKATLEQNPDIIIDDGGDLVYLLHTELPEVARGVMGGCEETTTGVLRLRALEENHKLLFPMLAVNDAQCKHLFDNRYGTGESVVTSLMRNTNLVMSGKTLVVMGYGWCGRGVARKAAGLGCQVIVCEVDPVKAIEAHMDGYQVMNSLEAVKKADMLVTVTGCKDIITQKHLTVMKDGAILANAGHFNLEINLTDLKAAAVAERTVRQNIAEYQLADGRKIYLVGEGRLVNLAAGDGHPAEIMDLSFALQALSAWSLVERRGSLTNRVYDVSREIDERVARIKLASLGLEIDRLSSAQEAYLHSWNGEG